LGRGILRHKILRLGILNLRAELIGRILFYGILRREILAVEFRAVWVNFNADKFLKFLNFKISPFELAPQILYFVNA